MANPDKFNEAVTRMSKDEATHALLAMVGVIMKMSDEAEALGGAMSIAGVASLHKLQTSLQKNGHRMAVVAAVILGEGGQ